MLFSTHSLFHCTTPSFRDRRNYTSGKRPGGCHMMLHQTQSDEESPDSSSRLSMLRDTVSSESDSTSLDVWAGIPFLKQGLSTTTSNNLARESHDWPGPNKRKCELQTQLQRKTKENESESEFKSRLFQCGHTRKLHRQRFWGSQTRGPILVERERVHQTHGRSWDALLKERWPSGTFKTGPVTIGNK